MQSHHRWPRLSLVTIFLLAACGSAVDTDRYRVHNQGLTFRHPEGWTVEEKPQKGGIITATITGPRNALMSIMVVPAAMNGMSLADYVSFIRQNTASAINSLDTSLAKLSDVSTSPLGPAGQLDGYSTFRDSVTLTLLDVPVPHSRLFMHRVQGDRAILAFHQAPDEDLAPAQPGFDMIRRSLKVGTAR